MTIAIKSTIIIQILLLTAIKSFSAEYYWVGGSGNWSEISHWATASGGSINHTRTPTADDNVIFDINSFTAPNQTVNLDGNNIISKNFTVGNVNFNPRIVSQQNTNITIYGSIEITDSCMWSIDGNISFVGSNQNMIVNFSSHNACDNITFNGTGSWIIKNKLKSLAILINQGELALENSEVECFNLKSSGTNNRTINFDNAKIQLKSPTVKTLDDDAPINIYPLYIDATNLITTNNGAKIEFINANSSILIKGIGNVILPSLEYNSWQYTANVGENEIINLTQEVNLTIAGDINIKSHLNIRSDLKLNQLILSDNARIGFREGGQYHLRNITGDGNCNSYIQLYSINEENPAALYNEIPFELNNYIIKNVIISGPLATANNSVKQGITTGWNIIEKTSETFYWIGRNDNWSNPSGWSLTSGGSPSGCTPTLADNVIFDNNSFTGPDQFIIIDQNNVYCKDMFWQNNLNGTGLRGFANRRIEINGSLSFSPNMSQLFQGDIYFTGNGINNIIMSGKSLSRSVIFDNSQGTWILQDDFTTNGRINLNSGKVIFNNITANLNQFLSTSNAERSIELKSSVLNLEQSNTAQPVFELNADRLTIESGNSSIRFTNSFQATFHIKNKNNLQFNNIIFDVRQANLINDFNTNDTPNFYAKNVKINSSAVFNINASIDTLSLLGANDFTFSDTTKIEIGKLVQSEFCKGMIHFKRASVNTSNSKPILIFKFPDEFLNFSIREVIAQSTMPINLKNSIDQGGNTGWNFLSKPEGRTLYFVSNNFSNDWYNEANWSLVSGGQGGECIPTEIDDVIFDNNSKLRSGDFVRMPEEKQASYCKSFTCDLDIPNIGFFLGDLNVHGNFYIKNANDWQTFLKMSGNNEVTQEIEVPENFKFKTIEKNGLSTLNLQSNIDLESSMSIDNGLFYTNDFSITIGTFFRLGNKTPNKEVTADLGKSPILLKGGFTPLHAPLTLLEYSIVKGEHATIEFNNNSNSGLSSRSMNAVLGSVINSNILGTTIIETLIHPLPIRKIILEGNGEFRNTKEGLNTGKLLVDTLIFSPNKSYIYQSGFTQEIKKYFQARGNNCNPISVRSSNLGNLATIEMPSSSRINMDFVQMQDMKGLGGADFNAGPYSTNINQSNVNWIFPDLAEITEVFGFLGPDLNLCQNQIPYNLDAYSQTPNEKYTWSNGSTFQNIDITSSGKYHVQVTFGTNCTISDTIEVFVREELTNFLPPDTVVCNSTSLPLQSKISDDSFIYHWSTGDSTESISVDQTGTFSLTILQENCLSTDSVLVTFSKIDSFSLDKNLSICSGDTATLNAYGDYDQWSWQNGSTEPSIQVFSGGTYWVEVSQGICKKRDSTVISILPLPTITSPSTYTICDGSETTITLQGIFDNVLWSGGQTQPTLTITQPGQYPYQVSRAICNSEGSINVNLVPIPDLDLDENVELCQGERLTLSAPSFNGNIIWSNGETTPNINIRNGGLYKLSLSANGCVREDSVNVVLINCSGDVVYFPNIFSPVRSSVDNQFFQAIVDENYVITSYELSIYDRQGSLIYYTIDVNALWEGTFNGVNLENGVYSYVCKVSANGRKNVENKIITGAVTLFR
jgi:gliding motility-associated-like protein